MNKVPVILILAATLEGLFFISLHVNSYWMSFVTLPASIATWLLYFAVEAIKAKRASSITGIEKLIQDRRKYDGVFPTSWSMLENFPTVLVAVAFIIPTFMLTGNLYTRSNTLFPIAESLLRGSSNLSAEIGEFEHIGLASFGRGDGSRRRRRLIVRVYGSERMALIHVDFDCTTGLCKADSYRVVKLF
jgi:hypothetical protein